MPHARHFADPDELTFDQRFAEIAAIFAQGCRRVADSGPIGAESSANSPDPSPTCLDRARVDALMDEPVDGTGERRVVPCP